MTSLAPTRTTRTPSTVSSGEPSFLCVNSLLVNYFQKPTISTISRVEPGESFRDGSSRLTFGHCSVIPGILEDQDDSTMSSEPVQQAQYLSLEHFISFRLYHIATSTFMIILMIQGFIRFSHFRSSPALREPSLQAALSGRRGGGGEKF